ncbi:MAG: hypothetical protein RIK85_07475 [Marinobacter sp.]
MNPDLLTLLNDPSCHLNEIIHEASEMESSKRNRRTFAMVSEDGEVVGYIKTWHDEGDYAGFVHFDTQGNIVDWKAFTKVPGSKRRTPSNFTNHNPQRPG